tara:strand:- start:354 stop:596 length:243 start_codon:yes stop_codon:yes gene_type:complete
MFKKIIAILLLLTSLSFAEGNCTYNKTTITENGVITSEKEIKICDETVPLGQQSFLTKDERMQMFETGLILTFLFILENM